MKHCKKCDNGMTLRSYESADGIGIHTHHICNKNEDHPYYCVQERKWVGT